MPRIADFVVACSIYLYETEQDATEGSRVGGSGFLAHVPSRVSPSMGHLYAITNKHVVEKDCGVIRLSRKTGGFDTIITKYQDWFIHPDGDDVAALPLNLTDETMSQFAWWSVGTDMFITREIIEAYRVGIGDEAFMVGRLMSHDGRQKNAPVIRFGNISLMADPTEPIRCEGRDCEGFLVECRSLSGFSGSPVFVQTTQVYRNEQAKRVHEMEVTKQQIAVPPPPPTQNSGMRLVPVSFQGTWGPWLLGIDWGHMPLYRSVERNGVKDVSLRVELNTGIACVAPVWKIMDVLNLEELMKERAKEDRAIESREKHEASAVSDVATKQEPFTRTDFETALKKASRKITSDK
jgi:hypothetical protein